jgi:hypothetical protein
MRDNAKTCGEAYQRRPRRFSMVRQNEDGFSLQFADNGTKKSDGR